MHKFALKKIDSIIGKINFYHLIVDGVNLYEQAENILIKHGNYDSELKTLQARMQEMAEFKPLPHTKCKILKSAKDSVKEYELKTKNLRCYLFKLENTGRIIAFVGKKNNQKNDIKYFRGLKKRFLEQLQK